MKLGNPDLYVVAFVGDGDAMGEGLEHVLFAAKRNADITIIMHNNGVYGLTTGQFTPVSPKGFKGPSTPFGSVEEPLNPIKLVLDAGATFVARGYSAKIKELTNIFVEAILHKGFSFVDVLQPCVSFNDTYELYNKNTFFVDKIATTKEEAIEISNVQDKIPLGIFYKEDKPVHHELLLEGKNLFKESLTKEKRLQKIREFLNI
jgi:2-oxoglutarate ferredoxin oxidoreductase subunit beta